MKLKHESGKNKRRKIIRWRQEISYKVFEGIIAEVGAPVLRLAGESNRRYRDRCFAAWGSPGPLFGAVTSRIALRGFRDGDVVLS